MKTYLNPETGVHKAGWIVVDPQTVICNGFIRVESGTIREVGAGKVSGIVIDHGPGALIPTLVNAHTHLELTALKGKIPFGRGFLGWIKELMFERSKISPEALAHVAEQGIEELINSGCGAVGDISTMGITKDILLNSNLSGVWFKEYLGMMKETMNDECGMMKNDKYETSDSHHSSFIIDHSVAGHAPHTTDPKMLIALKNFTRQHQLPFSIHVSESEEESEFVLTGKGAWSDFLIEHGVTFSGWGLPASSPVQHLNRLGIFDNHTIAVHVVHADKRDFEILSSKNVNICICPRSNRNIMEKLPDLEQMIKSNINVCLGTDSAASNSSLSMFDEMRFAATSFPFVPPAKILEMATQNGAVSLGMGDRIGALTPGKRAAFSYLPVQALTHKDLMELIVHYAHGDK